MIELRCTISRHPIIPGGAAVAALGALLTAPAAAQEHPIVPKFAVTASPIQLSGDVRPQQYVGVIGRRAAWLGKEIGEAELWVHPLKLASDFQLDFRIPDYVDPVRGGDVARTVEIRPELTTITYTHAGFTVRQHILAPLDEPGLLVLLDVDTFRPLEIIVTFRTVFQYAWPAAFGGQYTFWSEHDRAFVLSESLRQRNAFIGSPWATIASSHPAHALPDAPNTFVIPVDTGRAAREFVPIAVAAGIAPRDSVLAVYRRLITDAERLYREKRAHFAALLEGATSIDTPDDSLDLAFEWAKVNLEEGLVCNPDLGCGLVAGWGPSGQSTRPGFGWFFGGDAAINSLAMDAVGMWAQVAEGLRFLARYQRDDGKIPHEISQAAAHIPWFSEFPYTYYHADTTPYWILAVSRYWRASGDDELLAELWPAVRRAYRWCLTRETDGDGIIENGPDNLGAIEVGALGEGIHQDIYLAAVWIEALEAASALARARGETELEREADALRASARRTLNDRYWRPQESHHALGILVSGATNDNLTVWPATAAAFGLLDRDRAERTLIKLATDSISADWGARMLSTGSPLYDPLHYNNGAVWPFVSGFVIWAQYRYRRPWAGYPLLHALGRMPFHWSRGRHAELLSGRYYRPLDTAVPQQLFATSMLVTPLVMGLLGWEPDAPNGKARLALQLPPQWGRVVIRNLRVGETALDVTIEQSLERVTVTTDRRGPSIHLELAVMTPAGARDIKAVRGPVESPTGYSRQEPGPRGTPLISAGRLDNVRTTLDVRWSGGLAVEPPVAALVPGQESTGLRVLDFGHRDGRWELLVEGQRGRRYELRLHGESVRHADGATIASQSEGVMTISLEFSPGRGRETRKVTLHP